MIDSLPRTTPAARNRLPAYALITGTGISLIGNMLTAVALPWFVLQTTGSAAQTGLTGFAFALPAFAAGILGGALVDRLGGKRMSVISDLVSGFGVAMVPLLYATVGLAFWQLLLLVFLGALLDIPGLTARRALLPELAERGGIRPEAMNSAFEGAQAVSMLLGPPLAGLLIVQFDAVWVLWIDAVTFAVSALLVAVAIPDQKHLTVDGAPPQRYLAAIGEGLRFLRRDPLLFALAISLTVTNFLNEPLWTVVLPVLVDQRFGEATALGWLLTAFGIGAVGGSTLYGVVGHRFRAHRRALWLAGIASMALFRWALIPDLGLLVLAAAFLIGAFVGGPINPLLVTVRLERIPAALRGRVFSTFSALATGAAPLGMVATGFLIEAAGLQTALIVMAALFAVIVVAMFRVDAFAAMDMPAKEDHA